MMGRPTLVAHRGYPTNYPENTMIGYRATVEAGATWIETDIQITRDHVVVLYHDSTLTRISGVEGSLLDRTFSDLQKISASHESRFGQEFSDEPIATLAQLVDLINQHPQIQAMIEIKQESIDTHGLDIVLDLTYRDLATVKAQCVVISKNVEALSRSREEQGYRIGWVLPAWTNETHQIADQLNPDFMICKAARFPDKDDQIWQGGWQWMIYSIDEPATALLQPERGIELVETNQIGKLLGDDRLKL